MLRISPRSCLFWAAGLLSFFSMLLSDACSPKNGYQFLGGVFLSALILLCAWESHVYEIRNVKENRSTRIKFIFKRAFFTLVCTLGIAALGAVAASAFVPAYQCYTDRSRVSEMFRLLSSQREAITERIQTSKTLANSGAGLSIKKQGRIVGGVVTESGTMIAISQDPPAVVMLSPEFIKPESATGKGEVKWTCLGYPEKSMPMSCTPPITPP